MKTLPMDPYVRNTTNPAKRKGLHAAASAGHRSISKEESLPDAPGARYHPVAGSIENRNESWEA